MPFRVSVEGKSWLSEDLTLDECAEIEAETGDDWWYLVSAPGKSAKHARAIVVRLLARDHGVDEARKRAGQMTMRQLVESITPFVEDDRPQQYENGQPVVDPKADTGAPATT